jgi:hypothetical protein
MKTPHAILIGLALIAAAIFFQEPPVKPAQAAFGGVDSFSCGGEKWCSILDGDSVYFVGMGQGIWNLNWKTGESSVVIAQSPSFVK